MPIHLLIDSGNYFSNNDNQGDRAIYQVIIRRLRHIWPGCEIRWITRNTELLGAIALDVSPLVLGDTLVKVDPRYFPPTEVETLLGDPSKAKKDLGWMPEITAQDMCKELVEHDLAQAKRHVLLKKHGYRVSVSVE